MNICKLQGSGLWVEEFRQREILDHFCQICTTNSCNLFPFHQKENKHLPEIQNKENKYYTEICRYSYELLKLRLLSKSKCLFLSEILLLFLSTKSE